MYEQRDARIDALIRKSIVQAGLSETLAKHASKVAAERVLCEVNIEPPNPSSIAFHTAMGWSPVADREVSAGRFRQDLLFRLNTILIDVPPLRERPQDIPVLATVFEGPPHRIER